MKIARSDGLADFEEPISEIQRALVDFAAGKRRNIAVIGEPMAGKTALIEAVITRYGKPIRPVRLTSIARSGDDLPAMAGPKEILAVDDCQYLFLRRISGFAKLEKFLDTVASSGCLYVTAWNKFAWDYLKQVFTLGDYFPVAVSVPALGSDDIAAIIEARHEPAKVRYVDDMHGNGLLETLKNGMKLPGNMLQANFRDLRRQTFERITALSHGNPGVALAIWQRAYRDGRIRVSLVSLPEYETDMSPDEAFVLGNILMMKSVSGEDLLEITAGHLKMDRILYVLEDRGLIQKVSGRYSIEPLAMYSIIESLKKSRQVW